MPLVAHSPRLQDEDVRNNRDSLKNAELDTLVKHQLELKKQTNLQERQIQTIRPSAAICRVEAEEVFAEAARGLLLARRRQVEDFGRGLTSASKRASTRDLLEQEVSALEVELGRLLRSEVAGGNAGATSETTEADGSTDPAEMSQWAHCSRDRSCRTPGCLRSWCR